MGFTKDLISWYLKNQRDLPWRKTKDPYLIWVSEIILQQTRVKQGLPYYMAFSNTFPTVEKLARAKEETVLKLWQGLGYYSRAINMHQSAKYIYFELGGVFPKEYADVKNLKGVGPYTAAAICSFAYGALHPVVDGNVFRVLGRHFAIHTSIDTTEGKKVFHQLAADTMDKNDPDTYNQAIMEFGALQCKPVSPNCPVCPMNNSCMAYSNNTIGEFPVKSKTIKLRTRYFNYLVIRQNNLTFVKKRVAKDIWGKLYEYPLIETTSKADKGQLKSLVKSNSIFSASVNYSINKPVLLDAQLTHQKIRAAFWEITVNQGTIQYEKLGFQPIKNNKMSDYPIHRLIERYLLTKKASDS